MKQRPPPKPWLLAGAVAALVVMAAFGLRALSRSACSEEDGPRAHVSGPTPGGGAVGLGIARDGSCAALADGTVWCWGWEGSLGLVDAPFAGVPHPVGSRGPWASVSLSEHVRCLLGKDGHAECSRLDAARAPPLVFDGAEKVVLGPSHHCAIRRGELWCWGPNGSGQLFDRSTTGRESPVRGLGAASTVRDVAVGLGFTCARTDDGHVECRGVASSGNVVAPPDLPPVVALAAGSNHVCARTASGLVICWGERAHGEWGSSEPTVGQSARVALPLPAQELAASGTRTCALLSNADVWCWGEDDVANAVTAAPTRLRPSVILHGAAHVSLSPHHGCIVSTGHDLQCWGQNDRKQVSLHLPAYPSGLDSHRCPSWSEPSSSPGAPVFWPEGATTRAPEVSFGRRLGRLIPY